MKILHQSKDLGISEMQRWPSTLSKTVYDIDVCIFNLPGSNAPMECPENESRKGIGYICVIVILPQETALVTRKIVSS